MRTFKSLAILLASLFAQVAFAQAPTRIGVTHGTPLSTFCLYDKAGACTAFATLNNTTHAVTVTGISGATLVSSDITNALGYTPLRPSNNLSDVANVATARTNLGAQAALGFTPLNAANNLSDVTNVPAVLANIGAMANNNPSFTGDMTASSSFGGYVGNYAFLQGAGNALYFYIGGAGTNNKEWRIYPDTTSLHFSLDTDAQVPTTDWMTVSRSGTTVTGVTLPVASFNSQTVSYTLQTGDCGKTVSLSGGLTTATLPATTGFSNGCTIKIKNNDTRAKKLSGFPTDLGSLLWPQQVATVADIGGAWVTTDRTGRYRLSAATTFFVNPSTGNDSNDGLATGTGAFQTLQKAWDTLVAQVDLNNQAVTIKGDCASGALTFPVGLKAGSQPIGGGSILISGNATTPTNCVIAPTVANSVAFQAAGPVFYSVEGFYLNSSNILTGLYADYNGATIQVTGPMNFGTVAGYHIQSSHGFIFVNSNYTISAPGGSLGGHIYSAYGGQIEYGGITVTLTGTPAFFNFARASSLGTIAITGVTFSGAATGSRCVVVFNGMIETAGGGASYLPGNVACTISNGGIYD